MAATAVGQAYYGADADAASDHPAMTDMRGRRLADYDAAARAAKLAFFDIGER